MMDQPGAYCRTHSNEGHLPEHPVFMFLTKSDSSDFFEPTFPLKPTPLRADWLRASTHLANQCDQIRLDLQDGFNYYKLV